MDTNHSHQKQQSNLKVKITRLRDNFIIPENKYKIKKIKRGVEIKIDKDQLRYNPITKKTEKYKVEFDYYGEGTLK